MDFFWIILLFFVAVFSTVALGLWSLMTFTKKESTPDQNAAWFLFPAYLLSILWLAVFAVVAISKL